MPSATPAHVSLPDRYRVVRHLANGGMASVWEAHDELLDRNVAVKLLAPHLSEDDRARRRFQREARAAAGLSSHPNVVTIYDVGEHDGRVFMVMELMNGGTVADRLRSGREIPHETALRWLGEAAAALDAAHDAGIVHRDIKPANLLLDGRERLAIADFGIARLALEDQLTQTGQVLGTAAYISPEQAMGEPASSASDRYALAIVAFELLTGTRPFEAEHFAAQARAHVEDPPPDASTRAGDLPKDVDAVLQRGMAKEPADRWDSSDEFVRALRRALAAASGATARPRPAAGAAAGVAGGPPNDDGARRDYTSTGARRRGTGVLLGGLAGLLLLAVLGFLLLDGPGSDSARKDRTSSPSRSERRASQSTPTPTPTPTPTRTATPSPAQSTPTPTPTPTPAATDTPAPARRDNRGPGKGNPSELNDRGFRMLQDGDAERAVPVLKRAVDSCGDSRAVDPCAYAMYNYADALVRSDQPEKAIPVLQERLDRFDNQNGRVRDLLDRARAQAGKD